MSDAHQEPTPTQLSRARTRGQFAKSRELTMAIVWLGGFAVLGTMGLSIWKLTQAYAHLSWSKFELESSTELIWQTLAHTEKLVADALLPFMVAVGLLAILVHAMQTEFRIFPHRIKPDLDRLSPQRYFQRVFSWEHVSHICMGLAKLVLLVGIAIWVLWNNLPGLLASSIRPLENSFAETMRHLYELGLKLALATILLGIIDYGIQYGLHRRRMLMSEQEIREEQRTTEPAPEIGARRRLLSQQMRDQHRPNSGAR